MNARLVLGVACLALPLLAAVAAPLLAAVLALDPAEPDLFNRFAPPSAANPLGTDDLGRDVLLRLAYGARVSLAVGLATALAATVIGTAIGLVAAWAGGFADAALMRLADGVLALPALPLLVILAAFGWVGVARLARAEALSTLARDHVRAARALGVPEARLLWRHVLPALSGPVSVATALAVAGAILAESTLSFLGLGIAPPAASWGNMLAGAQDAVFEAPLAALWPGLCIMLAVAGATLLADGLRRRA